MILGITDSSSDNNVFRLLESGSEVRLRRATAGAVLGANQGFPANEMGNQPLFWSFIVYKRDVFSFLRRTSMRCQLLDSGLV